MRKLALLLGIMAAAIMLASGVAIAKNFQGNGKDNRTVGTSNNDTIAGSGGDDKISGKGGEDRVYGNSGADKVSGGAGNDDVFGGKGSDKLFGNGGNDYVNSADNRGGDVIDCGPGEDRAVIDSTIIPVSLEPTPGTDTTVNCESVIFVFIDPDTGTKSGDVENLQRNEVDDAVKAGILEEVE